MNPIRNLLVDSHDISIYTWRSFAHPYIHVARACPGKTPPQAPRSRVTDIHIPHVGERKTKGRQTYMCIYCAGSRTQYLRLRRPRKRVSSFENAREIRRPTREQQRLLLMLTSRALSAVISDSGGVVAHDRTIENLTHHIRTERRRVKENRGQIIADRSHICLLRSIRTTHGPATSANTIEAETRGLCTPREGFPMRFPKAGSRDGTRRMRRLAGEKVSNRRRRPC